MVTLDRPRGNLYNQGNTSSSSSTTAVKQSEVLLKRMDELLSRLSEAERQLSERVDYILPPGPGIKDRSGNPEEPTCKKTSDRFVGLLDERLCKLEDLVERIWRIVATLDDF